MRFQLPEEISVAIERIRTDNTSGATALTVEAAGVLARLPTLPAAGSGQRLHSLVVLAVRSLIAAQPVMAPIVNLGNTVLWEMEEAPAESCGDGLEAACSRFLERMSASGAQVSRNAQTILRDSACVVTHSSSQAVKDALIAAAGEGKKPRILCTESRPMREGVALARELSAAGLEVTLGTDAAIFTLMADADVAITGADSVSGQGVVNKTGTPLVALAARELGREFYSLCGSEKFLPAGYELPTEPMRPATEILEPPAHGISVWNRYFELTPLHLLSGVVYEGGILKGEDLTRRLGARKIHPALLNRTRSGASPPLSA